MAARADAPFPLNTPAWTFAEPTWCHELSAAQRIKSWQDLCLCTALAVIIVKCPCGNNLSLTFQAGIAQRNAPYEGESRLIRVPVVIEGQPAAQQLISHDPCGPYIRRGLHFTAQHLRRHVPAGECLASTIEGVFIFQKPLPWLNDSTHSGKLMSEPVNSPSLPPQSGHSSGLKNNEFRFYQLYLILDLTDFHDNLLNPPTCITVRHEVLRHAISKNDVKGGNYQEIEILCGYQSQRILATLSTFGWHISHTSKSVCNNCSCRFQSTSFPSKDFW